MVEKSSKSTENRFTILSAIVQGVLGPGRIDAPYALDVGRKWTLSEQLLDYYSPNEKVLIGGRVTAADTLRAVT